MITNFLTENEATTMYSDEEVENKSQLEYCLVNRTKEYFQNFLFLHPPINDQSRSQYLQTFKKDFAEGSRSPTETNSLWQFVSWLIEMHDIQYRIKNIYMKTVLDIIIDVIQKDLEFWCKHNKKKEEKNNLPLIKFLFDVNKNSYNEENLQVILDHMLVEIKVITTNMHDFLQV